jgi:hypothetical protein
VSWGSYINRHVFAYRNDSDAGRRVCVVADRGMISAETIAGLEARKLEYLLGTRERSAALLKTIVLANDDPFVPLLIERGSARENHRRPRCAIEEGRQGSHRQLGLSAQAHKPASLRVQTSVIKVAQRKEELVGALLSVERLEDGARVGQQLAAGRERSLDVLGRLRG